MASFGWTTGYERQGQDLNRFPNLKRWFETVKARPAVQRGLDVGKEERRRAANLSTDEEARKILFGQRARA